MPERRKRLTAKLNELDKHIEEGEPVANEVKEPLAEAIGQVRQVADSEPKEEESHETLGETIGDLAMNLEVSHPKLTEVLNNISELLSGAGI